MSFWENPVVPTLLALAAFLAIAELIRGVIPPLRTLGIPASIVAGALGLLLGPSVLGLVVLDGEVLEGLVYHGLAIVFIAVSLQTPKKGGGVGARSIAFGITTMVAMQTVVGLAIVLAMGLLLGSTVHPGLGLLLPLGFEQGPGQALSMGKAWEESGLTDGAQLGLIIAAIGFAWSVGVGIPLVVIGRARGWVSDAREAAEHEGPVQTEEALPAGALELLTRQAIAVACTYGLTWGACLGLSSLISPHAPDIGHMIWGFHFMIGALVAMGVRPVLNRLPQGSPLDDGLLGRLASTTVDGLTVAALSAVQLAVLGANLLPVLLITTVGGALTLIAAVALARRAFPEAWFEHCVLWFGMSTGTMPMGLALLRIIDPKMESPAPVSAVLGSAGAILGVAPIVLAIHPMPIVGFANDNPSAVPLALGASVVYLAVTLGLWWFTTLRHTGQGQVGSPAMS